MNETSSKKRGVLIGAGLACLMASPGTDAATYNFYFNNAEQGDNSTSTPTVVVKDGKEVASPDAQPAAAPAPVQNPIVHQPAAAPEVNEPPPQASLSQASYVPSLLPSSEVKHFRLVAGLTATTVNHTSYYSTPTMNGFGSSGDPEWGDTESSYSSTNSLLSPSISVSFFPVSFLGVTYFMSLQNHGLEGELVPISLGRNGTFELAFLGGGWSALDSSSSIIPFVGGRAQLNFGRHWGITLAYRKSLRDTPDNISSAIESGMVLRL